MREVFLFFFSLSNVSYMCSSQRGVSVKRLPVPEGKHFSSGMLVDLAGGSLF